MATTTTNYGFDVPQSSDLVKNGATQIALLGQDLDTFLFRPFTRNVAINGAFDIFQRGTSTTVNNAWAFVADRWMGFRATSCTFSQEATNDTTNLPNIQYCMRLARTAGDTNTGLFSFQQSVETANAIPYAGKQVTFSFYARAGANYSATSNLLAVFLYTGTGTDQNVKDGYTGSATPINTTVTLTTTWQRFSVTGTVAATAKEFAPYFTRGATGTAAAADYCEITGVQLEIGNQASPFIRQGQTIQGEISACQRYFVRYNSASTTDGGGVGQFYSTSAARISIPLPVTMRVAPSITVQNTTIDKIGTGNATPTAWGSNSRLTPNNVSYDFTGISVVGVAYQQVMFNGYTDISAEL
jgi:hypothetical protein